MADEHHCWEVKASIDALFLPSLLPPIQLGMGGGIRNAFLDCSGAEWAPFPSYSPELAAASSVTDSFWRNRAKHWKLLLVPEYWEKQPRQLGFASHLHSLCVGMGKSKGCFHSSECSGQSVPSEGMVDLVSSLLWVPECWQMENRALLRGSGVFRVV